VKARRSEGLRLRKWKEKERRRVGERQRDAKGGRKAIYKKGE
jgi:hypothetical protein